jgi:hypothetical protein
MQSARKAAVSSTPFHHQVNGTLPMRPVVLDAGRAVPPTPAALELHYRIEVWVNEGGAGGEANQ